MLDVLDLIDQSLLDVRGEWRRLLADLVQQDAGAPDVRAIVVSTTAELLDACAADGLRTLVEQ